MGVNLPNRVWEVEFSKCGYSIVVLCDPSKVERGVRFPLPAFFQKRCCASVDKSVLSMISGLRYNIVNF